MTLLLAEFDLELLADPSEDTDPGSAPLELPEAPHSYSRLSMLYRCPREFWASYVAKVPTPMLRPDPFDVGSRVHAGIEAAGNFCKIAKRGTNSFYQVARDLALDGLSPWAHAKRVAKIEISLRHVADWLAQDQIWRRWSQGSLYFERAFAVSPRGEPLIWDGDRAHRPAGAELCAMLDVCVVYVDERRAEIWDWKSGIHRRRPRLPSGETDPQLLLYAYALFHLEPRIEQIDVTFFNTLWCRPEPVVRVTRSAIYEARRWLDLRLADMRRRNPRVEADWPGTPHPLCALCSYARDCAALADARAALAMQALQSLPNQAS